MRKVIVSMNITLNGFMASADGALDWHFPFWDGEMAACISQQLDTVDTILLGRRSYQAMADYWPYAAGDPLANPADACIARRMNSYHKIVFSNTLEAAAWQNTRIMRGDISNKILALKQQPGADMIIFGSGSIVQSFMRLGLVDEYMLWVHPVILQEGMPLFKDIQYNTNLQLLQSRAFSTGVVILYYKTRLRVVKSSV